MLTEDQILYRVKEHLLADSWAVLGYRPPGGHGGFSVETSDIPGYSRCRLTLDLVAYRGGLVLCVEAKPRFSSRDRAKVDEAFAAEEVRRRILQQATDALPHRGRKALWRRLTLVKALAYGHGRTVPDDFVVFVVDEPETLHVRFGPACARLRRYLCKRETRGM